LKYKWSTTQGCKDIGIPLLEINSLIIFNYNFNLFSGSSDIFKICNRTKVLNCGRFKNRNEHKKVSRIKMIAELSCIKNTRLKDVKKDENFTFLIVTKKSWYEKYQKFFTIETLNQKLLAQDNIWKELSSRSKKNSPV